MKRILLLMRRMPVAEGLVSRSHLRTDFCFSIESDYERAQEAVRSFQPDVVVLEAAEDGRYTMDYCLKLLTGLKAALKESRLLLICPENDRMAVRKAVQAKQEKKIDDFVFYDASLDYLIMSLKAL